MKQSEDWLKKIEPKQGWYLAGFADGEGSFNVSFRQRDDHTMRWQVILTFNVSQDEKYILAMYKKILGCGRIQTRADGIFYYTVSNPKSIAEKVIPFFKRFRFWSHKKKAAFQLFSQITELVMQKQHLNEDGLMRIAQLREKLNPGRGRKRKYSIKDIEASLLENPQRLYAKPRSFRNESPRKI